VALIPLLRRDGSAIAYAAVDDADVALVSAHTWRIHKSHGIKYAVFKKHGRRTFMHRVILDMPGPQYECDHIDGDGLNNTRANLRVVSHAQNMQNRKSHAGSTSRYRGVYWSTNHQRWAAQVTIHGVRHRLGYFILEEEAARAASTFRANYMPFANEARQ
jgi:hypothetical protein